MKYVYQAGHFLLAISFFVLFLGMCYQLPSQQAQMLEYAKQTYIP